jgi:hypothetical protein
MAGLSLEPTECGGVRIATLHREQLPSALYGLLQVLFYDDLEESSTRFVSITCQQQMLTLIADGPRLERVPGLAIGETEWAVLRVDGVLDTVGALASLTSPLALAKIPVFHLSTYDSEFVLVPRERLSDALGCFAPPAPLKARRSGSRDASALAASAPAPAVAADAGADAASTSHTHSYPTHSYPLENLAAHPTTILRLQRSYEHLHVGALLRLLFFQEAGDEPQAVVSLTWSPDNELSIITGVTAWWAEHCASSPRGLSGVHQEEMVPISLVAPLDATGVVAATASVLAGCQISILGCSTLSGEGMATDFTLVPISQVDEARRAFVEAGFNLVDGSRSPGAEEDEGRGS